MKIRELTQTEIEAMSYDDLAYMILLESTKKMKITDLFKKVCNLMKLDENAYENKIADFFELLSTDRRFIMLEKGVWDLSERHIKKIKIEEDEEDSTEIEDIDDMDLEEDEEVEEDIFFEEDDDDDIENDLNDLVIVDEDEEDANSL